jgi:hypothetical protein
MIAIFPCEDIHGVISGFFVTSVYLGDCTEFGGNSDFIERAIALTLEVVLPVWKDCDLY